MIKELKYDLTKKDFNNWAKDLLKVKQYKKQRLLMVVKGLLIYFLFMFIIILPTINKIPNIIFPIILFFAILMGLLTFFISFPAMLKRNAKELNKGKDYSNNKLIINSDLNYIEKIDNNSNTEYKWSKIKNIYNLKYSILLFVSDYMSIIIPKRIFESEQEMNETWELIQECYNKNREEQK